MMQRLVRIFILLSLCIAFSNPSRVVSQTYDLSDDIAPLTQNRLVVFEAFMRST